MTTTPSPGEPDLGSHSRWRGRLLVLALILLLPVIAGLGEIQVLWIQAYRVDGTVYDTQTGAPLPNVTVLVFLDAGQAEDFTRLARAALKSGVLEEIVPAGAGRTDVEGRYKATALRHVEQRYWSVLGLHWRGPPAPLHPDDDGQLVAVRPGYGPSRTSLVGASWQPLDEAYGLRAEAPPVRLDPD
jgi:hypothetical protein